mmetsp:Transcript_67013/g.160605  ORF Transcript_67013/g.160605 Transcript_67013/m.160605 type:complete len:349 (-) Transcript_67013:104-1150(-)
MVDTQAHPGKPSLAKLLKYGIDPNSLSAEEPGQRRTLLCLVIEEGVKLQDMSKVDLLLEARADVDRPSENGSYPLQLAVKNECFQVSRQLLRSGASVNQADERQVTPLHLAARNSDLRTVQLLLMHKANVNAADRLGQTPMFFAGSTQVLTALLDASADVLHLNSRGQSALHSAAFAGVADVTMRLAEHEQMFHMLDLQDESGRTALHHAAFKGHQAVISCLMDVGADPRMKTKTGQTAMTLADMKEHTDVAYYIFTRISGSNRSTWGEVLSNPILLITMSILGVACMVWSEAFPAFVLALIAAASMLIGYANRQAFAGLLLGAIQRLAGESDANVHQETSQGSTRLR